MFLDGGRHGGQVRSGSVKDAATVQYEAGGGECRGNNVCNNLVSSQN